MRPRIKNGYNYRRQAQRIINPVLALACEGDTEEKYSLFMGRGRRIRIVPKVCTGEHGNILVDSALSHANQQRTKYPDAEIIPGAIYDLERMSDSNLKDAKDTVIYAVSRGVKIWVNLPTIERWFIMHHTNFSVFRSAKQAEAELGRILSTVRQPAYRKPGSPQFYTNLIPLTPIALANCHRTHIADIGTGEIPCFCSLIDFLQSY